MFKMLDLSIELKSAEKSNTFPLKGTSLNSIALNKIELES